VIALGVPAPFVFRRSLFSCRLALPCPTHARLLLPSNTRSSRVEESHHPAASAGVAAAGLGHDVGPSYDDVPYTTRYLQDTYLPSCSRGSRPPFRARPARNWSVLFLAVRQALLGPSFSFLDNAESATAQRPSLFLTLLKIKFTQRSGRYPPRPFYGHRCAQGLHIHGHGHVEVERCCEVPSQPPQRIELPGHVVQVLRCSTDVALRYCGKMSSLKELPTGFLHQ
jgi:hypothetical protein